MAEHLPRRRRLQGVSRRRNHSHHGNPQGPRHRSVSDAEHGRDSGRRPDKATLAVAILLLVLAAGVAYDAATIRGGVASYARIGPEVFPFAIAGGLAALGVATAISAY